MAVEETKIEEGTDIPIPEKETPKRRGRKPSVEKQLPTGKTTALGKQITMFLAVSLVRISYNANPSTALQLDEAVSIVGPISRILTRVFQRAFPKVALKVSDKATANDIGELIVTFIKYVLRVGTQLTAIQVQRTQNETIKKEQSAAQRNDTELAETFMREQGIEVTAAAANGHSKNSVLELALVASPDMGTAE